MGPNMGCSTSSVTGKRNKTPRTSEVSTQKPRLLLTRTNTERTLMSMRRLTTDTSSEISRCNHSDSDCRACAPRYAITHTPRSSEAFGLYEASTPGLKSKKPSMIVVLAPIIRLSSGGIKVGPIDLNQKVYSLINFLDTINTPARPSSLRFSSDRDSTED